MMLRALNQSDWPAVADIYGEGIRTRLATFEVEVPSWEAWDAAHLWRHRLVVVEAEKVVGWAALSPVSSRACYAGVAEDSVYVAPDRQGRGVGRALLEELVTGSEPDGIWTVQTSIFPENRASLALHLHCGFRVVGIRERIGRLDGVWRDTLLLERRAGAVPSQTPTHRGEEASRVARPNARLGADLAPNLSGAEAPAS